MPRELELTMAVAAGKAGTRPLREGTVTPDGVDPVVLSMSSPERHRRMLKFTEFDVCELSGGSFLASYGQGYPFTAIPVFVHRQFRHGHYFVNAEAGIDDPGDLEGGRVGVRRWQNTAALWMRGILEDRYDVDLSTVEWYIADEDEVPIDVPERFDVQRIPEGETLGGLLQDGNLDASLYPSQFLIEKPGVEFLFPDYASADLSYYRETGIFPIMHVVVIRDELIDEHPWLPTTVRQAFERASQQALDELEATVEERTALQWTQTLLAEAGSGYDPVATERDLWTNGIEANRTDLETMIGYGRRYGLLDAEVDPGALFVDSAAESLPEHN